MTNYLYDNNKGIVLDNDYHQPEVNILRILKTHYFEIESLAKDADRLSKLTLKNSECRLKINFYFGDYDFMYGNLIYGTEAQASDFDLSLWNGRILKIFLSERNLKIHINKIRFYNNFFKSAYPVKYAKLVSFALSHMNWFLQGLSKHVGIRKEVLSLLKKALNIDFEPIYLLNKFLTKEELFRNSNSIYLNIFFAQNQSEFLWDKAVLDRIFQFDDEDFFYEPDEKTFLEIREKLSTNKELLKNEMLLIQCHQSFDWGIISSAKNIDWNIKNIQAFKDYLNWDILSGNNYLSWNKEIIEFFSPKWNWPNLATNAGIDWDVSLANEFGQSREWSWFRTNHSIIDGNMIEAHLDKWDWDMLSTKPDLPWSEDFINKFKTKWNWSLLCLNKNVPWNKKIIRDNYRDISWSNLQENTGNFWNHDILTFFNEELNLEVICKNTGLPWSVELFSLLDKLARKKQQDLSILDNADTRQVENPLLQEEIWHKIFDGVISDDFIYEVIIKGLRFQDAILQADFETM